MCRILFYINSTWSLMWFILKLQRCCIKNKIKQLNWLFLWTMFLLVSCKRAFFSSSSFFLAIEHGRKLSVAIEKKLPHQLILLNLFVTNRVISFFDVYNVNIFKKNRVCMCVYISLWFLHAYGNLWSGGQWPGGTFASKEKIYFHLQEKHSCDDATSRWRKFHYAQTMHRINLLSNFFIAHTNGYN